MPTLSSLAKQAKPNASQTKKIKKEPKRVLSKLLITDSDLESVTESSESGSDSEEDVDDRKEVIAPTPKVTNVVKKAASSSSGSSQSDEEAGSDNESKSGTSSSEEEESDDELPKNPVDAPARVIAQPASSTSIPIRPSQSILLQPPSGFQAINTVNPSKFVENLRPVNLEGKQVWYITAPASIPLNTLKKISLRDIQKGKPAIKIEEQEYGFVVEKPEELAASKVMLPEQGGKQYRMAQSSIDKVLHLQRIVKLTPQTSSDRSTIPVQKVARPQPKGLKMRFRPIGFGDDNAGTIGESASEAEDSDVEMEDAPRTFRAPPKLPPVKNSDAEDSDSARDLRPVKIEPERAPTTAESNTKSKKRKLLDATNGVKVKKAKTAPVATPSIFASAKTTTPIPPPKLRTFSSTASTTPAPALKSLDPMTQPASEIKKAKKEKKTNEGVSNIAVQDEQMSSRSSKKLEKERKKRVKLEGGDSVHIKSESQRSI